MEAITYTTREDGLYTLRIKQGRRTVDKIVAASGGWYWGCRVFETQDHAINAFIESQTALLGALGHPATISVKH